MYKKICLNKLFFLKLSEALKLKAGITGTAENKMSVEQDTNKGGCGVAQRKSISGLRLRGLRSPERAAATSGSTSSHWHFSCTQEGERPQVWSALFSRAADVHSEYLRLPGWVGGRREKREVFVKSLSGETAWPGSGAEKTRADDAFQLLCQEKKKTAGIKRATAWDFSHLAVGELAGYFELEAIQVNVQQPDVGEDGCVQEAWAARSTLLQLRTQLQQQTKHVKAERILALLIVGPWHPGR